MESLKAKKQLIIAELEKFETKDERLKYIIECGKNMPAMDPKLKMDHFLIQGCISKPGLSPNSKMVVFLSMPILKRSSLKASSHCCLQCLTTVNRKTF